MSRKKNKPDKEAAVRRMVYPEIDEIERELEREKQKSKFHKTIISTVSVLAVVAATAVLITTMFFPTLQVSGNSMSPTFHEGDVLLAVKTTDFDTGDIVAFYYNNKIMVKRVIATAGDWVDIDGNGTVYVNDMEIYEPYITSDEKALGQCDIELPYQVPEGRFFVMGDHRTVSIDSRSTSVGTIASEQLVGKVVFRAWPFENFGTIK